MEVYIDSKSGYCFGVEYAIQMAEDGLTQDGQLYCLGDIVHNSMEVERLNSLGLRIIDREQLKDLKNCRVLIRAHGEPPETYAQALANNIELIDASCPVVLKLQNRIKSAFDKSKAWNGQIVIYGKKGHAEVIGLTGQTRQEAIVVSSPDDLGLIDYTRPVSLFSQTTKSTEGFMEICRLIEERLRAAGQVELPAGFETHDSICRQVSNREPLLRVFARGHSLVLFVAGRKSSNGKALFEVCLQENPRTYLVENETEVDPGWFRPDDRVGICGATSTPMWLMERVAARIEKMDLSPATT
jgi:4-hydroxy-3-methylbut-2-en-1-yl diphosphate reductase